jgi:hypothetical protein
MIWWEDNITIDITGRGREGVDWVDLAQDRVQCQSVVNTIMNGLTKRRGNFLTAERLPSSQERLCSMELVT